MFLTDPTPPTSQKNRPISFVLDPGLGIPPVWVPLVVRPEDLTRSQPSRAMLHQTLGRETVGWVDSFGPGLPTITIQGHTGWRAASGQSDDGSEQFIRLQKAIFDKYHSIRQIKIDFGKNPDGTKLLFVDDLDKFAYEVFPLSFTLRRSKARPLLYQYNIQLQAVSTTPEIPVKPIAALLGNDVFSGLGAFGSMLKTVNGLIGTVVGNINKYISAIAGPIKSFLGVVTRVFNAVKTVVSSVVNGVRSIANSIIGIARSMAGAARTIFNTIAAIKSIPAEIKMSFRRMAAAFNEAFCLLSGALKAKGKKYQDYSSIYGASNCSSTSGGRAASAYAETNVFSNLRPVDNPVVLSSAASKSLSTLEKNDPVTAPLSTNEIGLHADNVAKGYGGFSPGYVASLNETVGLPAGALA